MINLNKTISLHPLKSRLIWQLSILVLLGFSAFLLMLWSINNAVGVSPDSVIYLDTAENILAGKGIVAQDKPLTHYPPGYPFLLVLGGGFHQGDVFQGAVLLHSFLFGLNLFLVGFTVLLCCNNNLPIFLGAVLLGFVLSPIIFNTHAMAWSDPPFITLLLLAFILLTVYISRPKLYILVFMALLIGFAILVRYVGVTLLPPVIIVIFIWSERPFKQKIKESILVVFIAVAPLIVWFARNILVAQTLANRQSSFQFLGFHLNIVALISQFYNFILPVNMPLGIEIIQIVFVVILMIWGVWFLHRENYIRRYWSSPKIILPAIYIVFFLSYMSFMIFSQLFIEIRLNWDYRILLPAFLALLVFGLGLISALAETRNRKIINLGFVFVVAISLGINSIITISTITIIRNYGQGYSSVYWVNSETMTTVASLNDQRQIYSNGPDVMWYWTKTGSEMMPRDRLPGTRQPNQEYESQLLTMCTAIDQELAFLVYFERINRSYLPTIQEIEVICEIPLPIFSILEDGLIYGK